LQRKLCLLYYNINPNPDFVGELVRPSGKREALVLSLAASFELTEPGKRLKEQLSTLVLLGFILPVTHFYTNCRLELGHSPPIILLGV